jgi:hypothetical protein
MKNARSIIPSLSSHQKLVGTTSHSLHVNTPEPDKSHPLSLPLSGPGKRA